ncbi:MAG: DUF2007 domain-containing protein [Planctomycetaceae bacterium]
MNERQNLAVVAAVPTEPEATLIVGELTQRGIRAVTDGVYTAGHWAIAPGVVRVLVNKDDLDRAKEVMAAMHTERDNIDWSQVDVGEGE